MQGHTSSPHQLFWSCLRVELTCRWTVAVGPETCPAAVGTIDLHWGGGRCPAQLRLRALVTAPCQPRLGTHHLGCMPRPGQGQQRRGEDGRAQTVGLRDADLDTSEERSRSPCLGVAVPEGHVAENSLGAGWGWWAALGLRDGVGLGCSLPSRWRDGLSPNPILPPS